jgi:hypothetical protein
LFIAGFLQRQIFMLVHYTWSVGIIRLIRLLLVLLLHNIAN